MGRLPREIQKQVFTFFNEKELRNGALVSKHFYQLTHEVITELRSQYVVTYRYKTTIANDTHEALRGGHTITEFFIPSLSLCINKEYVYTSEKPRNRVGSPFLSESTTSPLTKRHLTPGLIDKIKQAQDSVVEMEKLNTDEEYQALFKRPVIYKEGQVLYFLKANDDNFQTAYKAYGNDAVLQEMLKYISGKKSQETSPLDDLVRIIESLDTFEIETLTKVLTDKISNIENKDDTFIKLYSTVSGLIKWGAPCAAGTLAGLKAETVTKNTLLALTTGVVVSALTFFAANACKDYLLQKQSVSQEKMKDLFFNLLKTQNIKLLDTNRNIP